MAQPMDIPLDLGLRVRTEALRLQVDRAGALQVQRAEDLGGRLSVGLDRWHGGLLRIWRVGGA